MEERYTPEGVQHLEKRAGKARRAALLAAAAGVLLSAAMCFGVRTENAGIRQALATAMTAAGLWAAVFLTEERALPLKREAEHEAGVLREAPEYLRGTVSAPGAPLRIPKSITFRPVTLRSEGREISLKLNAELAGAFPPEGTALRAAVRRGYITGWEADGDA